MTSCEIIFRLFDVTAAFDAAPSAGDLQPFSKLPLLTKENCLYKNWGTLEEGQFLLDGKHEFFADHPENENFGLWSVSMSKEDGSFEIPPALTLDFAENHSSVGLTFHFDPQNGDFCARLLVSWYDGLGALIGSREYFPDQPVFFCENHVDNYQRVEVQFFETRKPFRYLKLNQVDFGASIPMSGNSLVSARLLEEADPLSAEIRINTLDFQVYSEDARFSVVNPKGIYAYLQKKQRVDVYEQVDARRLFMGAFYLDAHENKDEKNSSMSCVDLVGILDQTNFRGGIYTEKPALELLDDLASSAGAGVKFELDPAFATETVCGYIPVCTYREALQQLAFAIGAIVDCSRSYAVRLYPPRAGEKRLIGYGQKIDDHSVKQRDLVTGAVVTAHSYTPDNQSAELFRANLEAGSHEIFFSAPAHSLTIRGGTIVESGANYAVINAETAGEVVVSGKGYTDNLTLFRAALPGIPANERMNEVTIDQATLIDSKRAAAAAQRVLDYYQNRLEATGSIILGAESVGDTAELHTLSRQVMDGCVESLDIDLTGGNLAKTSIVGRVK